MTLWVVALVAIIWRPLMLTEDSLHLAINVFWDAGRAALDGLSPYDVTAIKGSFVDTPSAVLFVAPLALLSLDAAHVVKLLIDIACLVGAIVLLARTISGKWASVSAAVMVLVVAHLEVTAFILKERNWEPQILLAFVAVVYFVHSRRWMAAATTLGVSLALKPLLGPLALLFILARRWRALGVAIAIPLVLNAAGYAITPGAHLFFDDVVPFLLRGQSPDLQSANVSLPGLMRFEGVAEPLVVASTAAVALAIAYLVWQRASWWLKDDENQIVLIEIASLLILGVLLCFSYSFSHYAIYCLPLMLTVVDERSSMRTPLLGFAAVMTTGIFITSPWALVGELLLVVMLASKSLQRTDRSTVDHS
jgi:arabinofuranan 3-O-arabinosyltransferase